MTNLRMSNLRSALVLLLLATLAISVTAQAAGQHYFRFQIKDKSDLKELDKVITIDRCSK